MLLIKKACNLYNIKFSIIETHQLICTANQWTGFYAIEKIDFKWVTRRNLDKYLTLYIARLVKGKKRIKHIRFRSSHQRCSIKKNLKNFEKFAGKTPMPESLFNKVVGLRPAASLKKRPQHWCFPVHFAKYLRAPILKKIFERLLL